LRSCATVIEEAAGIFNESRVSVFVRARGILMNGRFAHSPLQTRQTHGNARIRENAAAD
jgi:hypothetical protein